MRDSLGVTRFWAGGVNCRCSAAGCAGRATGALLAGDSVLRLGRHSFCGADRSAMVGETGRVISRGVLLLGCVRPTPLLGGNVGDVLSRKGEPMRCGGLAGCGVVTGLITGARLGPSVRVMVGLLSLPGDGWPGLLSRASRPRCWLLRLSADSDFCGGMPGVGLMPGMVAAGPASARRLESLLPLSRMAGP